MATVYVVTAGSGDTSASSGSISTASRRIGSRRITTGLRRLSLFSSRNGGPVPRRPSTTAPYWRAEWWARIPAAKRRGALRHTDEGERFDDFAIRQEWWTRRPSRGGAPGTGQMPKR